MANRPFRSLEGGLRWAEHAVGSVTHNLGLFPKLPEGRECGEFRRDGWITVSLSSLPVRAPPEFSAMKDYAQISSGAESLFPLLMPEDVFSEVHP
jgi:hypothetical protein